MNRAKARLGFCSAALLSVAALGVLAATGCDDKGAAASASTQPVSWLSPAAPAEAISVQQAKANAKEGEAIVVRGRIGGRSEPLSARSPVFTIIDMDLDACAGCSDSCGVSAEELRKNIATVQIVDASGKPVSDNPIAAGLKAEDEVVIQGTVAASPGSDTLMILATSIHRVAR